MNFLRVISNLLRFDRTNWKALALCLFAASIFWIFNALNKNYSANLALPLHVEFDASKYAPAEPLPPKLIVNVNGNGWELLRKHLGLKVPIITLPLERPTEVHKIPGAALSPYVISQLTVLQLNSIVLDTLRLHIEPKVSRKVMVMADLSKVTFKKNYDIVGPAVMLPDTVLLEGPASFVEALNDTLWVPVMANRINSRFRETMEVIIDHNEFISRNPPVVEVTFDVGLIEEIKHTIKLDKPKLPPGTEVGRDSVQFTLVIPQQDHERFMTDAPGISATVKVPKLAKGDTIRIKPILNGLPAYAKLVRVDSIELRKH